MGVSTRMGAGTMVTVRAASAATFSCCATDVAGPREPVGRR